MLFLNCWQIACSASSKINDCVLRVSWAQVSAFSLSACQVVSIHVSHSHGHHPTWLPTFHPLIVWFPQFCLPSQSLKNPLARAHLSASDLVRVHRMSNFPASLGGANCLLITYKLTHPPCTRTHKYQGQINKQSQGIKQRLVQSPQWAKACKIPWGPFIIDFYCPQLQKYKPLTYSLVWYFNMHGYHATAKIVKESFTAQASYLLVLHYLSSLLIYTWYLLQRWLVKQLLHHVKKEQLLLLCLTLLSTFYLPLSHCHFSPFFSLYFSLPKEARARNNWSSNWLVKWQKNN